MRARRVMLWIAPVIGIVLISWMANRPTNLKKERVMKNETPSSVVPSEPSDENDPGLLPIAGDDAEWQKRLTPEQFKVTRRKGTERAFTGELWDNHEPGIYRCVCCGQKLFDADAKFESGTGWPSFFQPLAPRYVGEISDRSWFMVRTEVVCSRCDAHLGHVFDDGPKPTGLRYCMNSAAMTFEKRDATDSAKEKSGPDSR